MHIGVVGGLERSVLHCAELALGRGHSFEWHEGATAGRGVEKLESLIERSDLVIVATDVNSHGGVLGARRLARSLDRDLMLVRRFGVAAFRKILEEVETRRAA
jgi:hypothetical protein